MTDMTAIDQLPQRQEIDKISKQVQLHNLVFSQSWEDPESDKRAFGDLKGKSLFTITSGGDNALDFLLQSPVHIYAVDINPAQRFLLELKKAAIVNLPYQQFSVLMGIQEGENSIDIYKKLRKSLLADACNYWDSRQSSIQKGILYTGKFERFMRYARWLLRMIQGKHRIEALFEERDIDQQHQFYKAEWDNWRMRLLFKLVFHRSIYPRGALKADYFTFADGSTSFAESFSNRFSHALSDLDAHGNYFLAMYLLGRYHHASAMPAYLQESNYTTLRDSLDRLELITENATVFLEHTPANSIDRFSLSNICELMSAVETEKLFQEVARTATPDARICFRNLIIPRDAPAGLIRKNEKLSQELVLTDRSFIYSKVAAYNVIK